MSKRGYTLLAIGCLTSIIAHFRWFNGFGFLVNGDWQIQLSESARTAFSFPSIWLSYGIGGVNINAPFYVLHVVQGGLSSLGLSFGVVERLEYFWPITVLSYAGIFLLIRRVTKSDIGAFVGSFVYAFSVCFLLLQTQHIYIMLADVLAPLAVLAYINALDKRRAREIVWAGLALFIVSAADFRIFYILALVLLPYAVARAIADGSYKNFRQLTVSGLVAGVPFALTLLLCTFWIIGFMSTTTLTNNALLNRPIFGGKVPITNAINLWSGAWTGGATEWFGNNPVAWWFWIYPLIAMIGFWVARRKKYALFFLFIALFAIFFGKQTNAPFGEAYTWMHANFPGFNAFREASKFKFLHVMGYSTLIGFFVSWVCLTLKGSGWRRYLKYAVIALLIALPVWNTKPLITGEIGATFVEEKFPADYLKLNEHLRDESYFYRIIWTPRASNWVLSLYHPHFSVTKLEMTEPGQQMTESNVGTGAPGAMLMTNVIAQETCDALLDLLSVRYVAMPLVDEEGQDVFDLYYMDRQDVINKLDEVSYLHRVDLGLAEMTVYENDGYRPYIYISASPENDETYGQEISSVNYSNVNTTEHTLNLSGVSGEVFINFTEEYHPDWTLYPGRFGWWSRLTARKGQPAGVIHERSWVGLNQFKFDVDKYCSENDCIKNDDGGYDIELAMYFQPQKYFYVGFIFSIAVLAACLTYLSVDFLTRRRNRKRT